MKDIALVFIGGGLGSVVRFLIGKEILARYTTVFPWATLGVNILASVLLGIMVAVFHRKPENTQWALVLVGTGFCGGLSTFSTFSYENFSLIQKGEITLFFVYTLVSFAACVVGVAAGYLAIRNL